MVGMHADRDIDLREGIDQTAHCRILLQIDGDAEQAGHAGIQAGLHQAREVAVIGLEIHPVEVAVRVDQHVCLFVSIRARPDRAIPVFIPVTWCG